jgi:anthranilate phosphoribosyltransferase
MVGDQDPALVAAYLTALRLRGESADALAGTARTMKEYALPLAVRRTGWADTCGTGGSPVSTFNISTAAAIVASAVGVPIAKHGNRSFSSSSGSADVLSALGVDIQAPADRVVRALEEIGLAFLFAPLWHPAMKHVAPVRQALRFRTIFNLVGPLANPLSLAGQVVGVGRRELLQPMAEALVILGVPRAAVLWAEDGTDEVSLASPTHVIRSDAGQLSPSLWTPSTFGCSTIDPARLAVSSSAESAQVIREILAGSPGPAADTVHANVASLLWLLGRVSTLEEGMARSRDGVASGRAKQQLDRLIAITTNSD